MYQFLLLWILIPWGSEFYNFLCIHYGFEALTSCGIPKGFNMNNKRAHATHNPEGVEYMILHRYHYTHPKLKQKLVGKVYKSESPGHYPGTFLTN